jgi:hypothetical protein
MTLVDASLDCVTGATPDPGRSAMQSDNSYSRSFPESPAANAAAMTLKESGLTYSERWASSCSTVPRRSSAISHAPSTAAGAGIGASLLLLGPTPRSWHRRRHYWWRSRSNCVLDISSFLGDRVIRGGSRHVRALRCALRTRGLGRGWGPTIASLGPSPGGHQIDKRRD